MSESPKTFVDLYLDGEAIPEEIDDFVDQWHDSNAVATLAEFLGFRDEEYAVWVEHPQSLSVILFARKHHVPLRDLLLFADQQMALAGRQS